MLLLLACVLGLSFTTTSAYGQGVEVDLSAPSNFDDDFGVDDEWDMFEEPESAISDPFYRYNKFMFNVNDKVYTYIFNPLAKVYNWICPKRVQKGFDNIFTNARSTIPFFNNLFQAKFKNASTVFGRFAINSTVGIGGLFDPAESFFKLKKSKEDFGQTLGHYGIGSGPYLVLPLLGPSSGRDLVGFVGDRFLNPFTWFGIYDVYPEEVFDNMTYLRRVNAYAYKTKDAYQEIMEDAFDPYSALQNFYVQYRESQIKE